MPPTQARGGRTRTREIGGVTESENDVTESENDEEAVIGEQLVLSVTC